MMPMIKDASWGDSPALQTDLSCLREWRNITFREKQGRGGHFWILAIYWVVHVCAAGWYVVGFLTVLCRIKYCSFENQWLSSNTSICGKLICGIKQLEILVGDRIANFGSFCRIGFKNSAEHSLVEAKAFTAQWHTYPLPCRLSLAGHTSLEIQWN